MAEPKVIRLETTGIVKFGPDAFYQPILGDDEGSTPVRIGIQTSEPGYAAPMHSHPYLEVLHGLYASGVPMLKAHPRAVSASGKTL